MVRKKKASHKKDSSKGTEKKKDVAILGSFEETLIGELNKDNNETPAQLLSSDGLAIKIKGVISTQAPSLDRALGRWGIPLGRTTMVHGHEGSGKSTLALHCVAETQRVGGMAVYIDTEYKLDPEYAKAIGVNTSKLTLVQPRWLEMAFSMIETTIGVVSSYRKEGIIIPTLIVLDSINATKAKAVIQGDWDDPHVSPEAKVWSEKFPKLVPLISEENVALLLISQVREKIGVMFGSKDRTAGGNTPRFYASILMGVERREQIRTGDGAIGNETSVYVQKNCVAPPFKNAKFRIMYGKGIDYELSLVEACIESGVMSGYGSWISAPLVLEQNGEPVKAQGREAMANKLREEPALCKELYKLMKLPIEKRKTIRKKGVAKKATAKGK